MKGRILTQPLLHLIAKAHNVVKHFRTYSTSPTHPGGGIAHTRPHHVVHGYTCSCCARQAYPMSSTVTGMTPSSQPSIPSSSYTQPKSMLQAQRRTYAGTLPLDNGIHLAEIPSYKQLLRNNKDWAIRKRNMNKDYFNWLASGQNPPFLYIGCSDSRMALNDMVGSRPGSMFVHRNIANQVCINDMGFLSVLTYAVEGLKVKHIIVCGHYDCGGIKAAMDPDLVNPVVSNWVNPVKRLYVDHKEELMAIPEKKDRIDRLVELNVIQQCSNLCQTAAVRNTFKTDHYPQIHGWICNIYSGLIKELELPLKQWVDYGYLPEGYLKTMHQREANYTLIVAIDRGHDLHKKSPDIFFPE